MGTDNVEMVTITKEEYRDLQRAQAKLEALEVAGVDNWEWYGDALEDMRDIEED